MTYTAPITLELNPGKYKITMPNSVTIDNQTYNFNQWENGSINPARTLDLTGDLIVTANYIAVEAEAGLPILPVVIASLFIAMV